MGTTLHGIIEWSDSQGRWDNVAEVEFNKNYTFMRLLHELAARGWPKDVSIVANEYARKGRDQGHSWCDLQRLKSLLRRDDLGPDSPPVNRDQPKAVKVFMASLEEDGGIGTTRILFYEM